MADDGTVAGRPTVGLVLAGGGARGAYEAGVLSVLLPALEARGETPRVLVGTSIGALNVGVVASLAHRGAAEVADGLLQRWRDLRTADGLVPLRSLGTMGRLARLGGQALGLAPPSSLLDLSPYAATIAALIDFDQLHANVADGTVGTAAVATTSYSSGECVVFHESAPGVASPRLDERRLIRYAPTALTAEHVRASGSMQVLARSTRIDGPDDLAGWYGDGAARLNTPIKPALRLGADKVVVVGLDPIAPPARPSDDEPHVFDAMNQLLAGLLADQLAHDVATLASRNAAGADPAAPSPAVPYCFVVPEHRDVLGELARQVYAEHLTGPRAVARNRDLVTVGRLVGAGRSAAQGSLFSMLFIHPAFAEALIERGQADAERWLAEHPDLWQLGP